LDWLADNELRDLLNIILIIISLGVLFSLILLVWVIWRVKRINLPADADPVTALLATPFVVVVLLDLLDLTLDFLAAPLAWILLSHLGLRPLRGVTLVWVLIPGTQVLPIMSLSWFFVRLMRGLPHRSR
jgi:hypothetical protein